MECGKFGNLEVAFYNWRIGVLGVRMTRKQGCKSRQDARFEGLN